MSELEDTADHLLVVGRGRLLADVGVAELIERASKDRVDVRTEDREGAMTVLANAGGTVAALGADRLAVEGMPSAQVSAALTAAGVAFSELHRHRASLEEAYMELTRDETEFAAKAGAA
jgi:ABC-2 type transport system ATP-binding protein